MDNSDIRETKLYWVGPRVSDVQDCIGLFDGAITIYGFDGSSDSQQNMSNQKSDSVEKYRSLLKKIPSYCNSCFNIDKDGYYLGHNRINHNDVTVFQDLYFLYNEMKLIIENEYDDGKKKDVFPILRFMTYNPNYVGRHGTEDYFTLLAALYLNYKEVTDNINVKHNDVIRNISCSEDEDFKNEFSSKVCELSKWFDIIVPGKDREDLDKRLKMLCNVILDHIICFNNDEDLMKSLDQKDEFRKLCSVLEVSTTERIPYEINAKYFSDKNVSKTKYAEIYADMAKITGFTDIVAQRQHSSGGFGTYLIRSPQHVEKMIEESSADENKFILSHYRFPNVPLNIHAVIEKYNVILLPPSIQIITDTNNKLIYSGADFYAYQKYAEENPVIDTEFRDYVMWVCRSLQSKGYRGVIGFDAIVSSKGIEFVEANNRFQASTVLINKSLYEHRFVQNKDGFPIHRVDGKRILGRYSLPSVQHWNLKAFESEYDEIRRLHEKKRKFRKSSTNHKSNDEETDEKRIRIADENYYLVKQCIRKFKEDNGILNKSESDENDDGSISDDPFSSGMSLLFTKVPYSCFIYYNDESNDSVNKLHYSHMVSCINAYEKTDTEAKRNNDECLSKINVEFEKLRQKIIKDGDLELLAGKYGGTISELYGCFNKPDHINRYSELLSIRDANAHPVPGSTHIINDDLTNDEKKIIYSTFVKIDDIFFAKSNTYAVEGRGSVFDIDLSSSPDTYKKPDYCKPGAYALKIVFPRNIVSVLENKEIVNPNIFPPSTRWDNMIRNREILPIKIGLLNNGINLDDRIKDNIRKGVNHSVDLTFRVGDFEYRGNKFDEIEINCLYDTRSSLFTPFSIRKDMDSDKGVSLYYYDLPLGIKATYVGAVEQLEGVVSSGVPLSSIAFVATDRIRYQHSDKCTYASRGRGCKFCEFTAGSKSSTVGNTSYHFGTTEINEAITKTLDSGYLHLDVDHVLIGGGTMEGDPGDVKSRIVSMCRTIRKYQPDKGIYLMIVPPSNISYLEEYKEAGVTEVSFNIEVYDQHLAGRYMPGKRELSTSGYISALRYATKLWGTDGKVRSALIIGLEPEPSALQGIQLLASIGVSPILSIFRPTPGTQLDWLQPFGSEQIFDFFKDAYAYCNKLRINFGPECIHCQNNTLVLPNELIDRQFPGVPE